MQIKQSLYGVCISGYSGHGKWVKPSESFEASELEQDSHSMIHSNMTGLMWHYQTLPVIFLPDPGGPQGVLLSVVTQH